ncbi:hypothetical protein BDD39_000457 [Saccharococcus thermophilus]|uniref:Uncharacterized protein n=1 Tax=Saccharococcus thermophilus TaxID=29396 RepID=A0A846MBV4_9BACL|nr:hypothetical protein [Saccharococcus thermophilus]
MISNLVIEHAIIAKVSHFYKLYFSILVDFL